GAQIVLQPSPSLTEASELRHAQDEGERDRADREERQDEPALQRKDEIQERVHGGPSHTTAWGSRQGIVVPRPTCRANRGRARPSRAGSANFRRNFSGRARSAPLPKPHDPRQTVSFPSERGQPSALTA